jgi:hypothetical protein
MNEITDNSNNEENFDLTVEDERKRIRCNQDFLLTIMVSTLNSMAASKDNEMVMSQSITVVLNGAIISGLLISGFEYGNIFVEKMKQAWRNANITGGKFTSFSEDDISNMVSSYEKMFQEIYKKDRSEEDKERKPPTFFHMKDVIIKYSNGTASELSIFRGKIKDVNGFSSESV